MWTVSDRWNGQVDFYKFYSYEAAFFFMKTLEERGHKPSLHFKEKEEKKEA